MTGDEQYTYKTEPFQIVDEDRRTEPDLSKSEHLSSAVLEERFIPLSPADAVGETLLHL